MANLRTISQFKSTLSGGGARANLFEVDISFPGGPNDAIGAFFDGELQRKFQFLCKAAQLPASNVSPIEIPFRGRTLKVAGDRTVDPWTITIINDENFAIRTAFEKWMNAINKMSDASGLTTPASYMGNATVRQLGRGVSTIDRGTPFSSNENGAGGATNAIALRTYTFVDIFPTNVSAIDVSYDSSDTIEEFTVELQVQYWVAGTGSADGSAENDQEVIR